MKLNVDKNVSNELYFRVILLNSLFPWREKDKKTSLKFEFQSRTYAGEFPNSCSPDKNTLKWAIMEELLLKFGLRRLIMIYYCHISRNRGITRVPMRTYKIKLSRRAPNSLLQAAHEGGSVRHDVPSSGLDPMSSDDGNYTAVQEVEVVSSLCEALLVRLTARWALCGLLAEELVRKHGRRGLHVRNAARWCSLGIHLERGREGLIQTFPGLTGMSVIVSCLLNLTGCGIHLQNSRFSFMHLHRCKTWIKSPWYQFFLSHSLTIKSSSDGREWIQNSACHCIFLRVGCVLVRDSSGPLYGQGQECVWSRGQYELLSLSERREKHRFGWNLECERCAVIHSEREYMGMGD